MRIALISTCAVATPPKGYGGTELVMAELAKGLVRRGHDVTVYATGDSAPVGRLKAHFPEPVWPPNALAEQRHAAFAMADLKRNPADVVHMNHPHAIPFCFAAAAPCVATIHHERDPELAAHYAAFPRVAYVAISRRQAELSPDVPFARVIHHGLDPENYPFGDRPADQLAFLGRFCAQKGTHLALDAALRAGKRVVLGGAAHEIDDALSYFQREIQPRLARAGDRAQWLGELGHVPKVALLRSSKALLFPIQWEEPFGLVMIESMLVGTPVIGFRRGSAPEVIEEGVTGFLVDDEAQMAERIACLDGFDRARCRARAKERWSTDRMAAEYEALYETCLEEAEAGRRASGTDPKEANGHGGARADAA